MIDVPLFLLLGVLGLIFGSFFNVCIGRLPAGESVVSPPSRCPSCKSAIAWYDNIPVLSYIALGGKCRRCRTRISLRYPATEIATSAAFVVQGFAIDVEPWMLLPRLIFTGILVILFGTDLETKRLPNVLTIPGIAIGLGFSVFLPPGFVASALGAVFGAGILLAVRWIWKALRGIDAMGLGDVKMLAMIGAFLGWQQVPVVLLLASVAGAIIGIGLTALRGRSLQTMLPFGTFLALAAYAASLFGEKLLRWYLGMFW